MNLQQITLNETEDHIILNKPAGLLSIPDREGKDISLKQLLKEKYGNIYTVHRLDRETSGVIVFAKTEASHKHLSSLFMLPGLGNDRAVKKIYRGLVLGMPPETKGRIESPIMEHPAKNGTMIVHRKGKVAITDYELLEGFQQYSFLHFRIHTGRTHQIRVHMKDLGHPVVCDKVYGDGQPVLVSKLKSKYKLSKKEDEERPLLDRLALHSYQLSFSDTKGDLVEAEAPVPKDLRAVLQQLNKLKKG
jgi:23S rRNA pseudouridine1911/1915/1917 synthase